jgi:hypothetical protein
MRNVRKKTHVGYLMARFDFFQDLFVQICVRTLISLIPSRAQRALSIAKKNFKNTPALLPKTPKNCKNRSKKRPIFRKPGPIRLCTIPDDSNVIPDRTRRVLSIPIHRFHMSPPPPPLTPKSHMKPPKSPENH